MRARLSDPIGGPRKVYSFWNSGAAHAPEIVRRCFEASRAQHGADLTLLDDHNLADFWDVPTGLPPQLVANKAWYSDVLRVGLLYRYGGVWLDATCYPVTNLLDTFPDDRCVYFARPKAKALISNWALSAPAGNVIMSTMYAALLVYWAEEERPNLGYFMFHSIFEALAFAFEDFGREAQKAVVLKRSLPHFLQRSFHKKLSPEKISSLLDKAPVHKFTHKHQIPKPDTVLDKVLSGSLS
ncbi:capsular polysaccharide synthesis protein [Salipiger sp. IMCC34102]|uniref:capsular polysaccharide synthesis protein n=1 Tax=Salipiger sp. IMCC34102 TaxID=2510647 RepID=UPI0013EC4E6D|nr:capsular polysaccharide synthesis protein [Salipiger sp. IMCC34102]